MRKVTRRELDAAICAGEDLSQLDVSEIEDFSYLFAGCDQVGDISTWDTRSARNMEGMFSGCKKFNQPVEHLNTSGVTDTSFMFYHCERFNQPIAGLDLSNVVLAESMFEGCLRFNKPIRNLNMPKLKGAIRMFYSCTNLDQTLVGLDFPSLHFLGMSLMFKGCSELDSPFTRVPFLKDLPDDVLADIFMDCPKMRIPRERSRRGSERKQSRISAPTRKQSRISAPTRERPVTPPSQEPQMPDIELDPDDLATFLYR